MAQKSLPILNKVGVSMLWYTTFFYKYYKWLAPQSLYLLYFFNKLYVYLDFIFSKFQWIPFYSETLYRRSKELVYVNLTKHRFHKPLTSYLINTGTNFSLINLYYSTTLETFQNISKSQTLQKSVLPRNHCVEKLLLSTFYL